MQQVGKRRHLLRDIAGLISLEESYWKQRSRVLWLTSRRKKKNTIKQIKDESGNEFKGDKMVGEGGVAVHYFEDLFKSYNPSLIDQVMLDFDERVTEKMNEGLQAQYTEEEVRKGLNQMHPIKAPGPYGMCPMFFFQYYWHIVGSSVLAMVLGILRGNSIPPYLNRTFITLIPKKSNYEYKREYKPISLCHVVYKLVSKVLANRLKTFLNKIVSVNQSASLQGA